MTRKDFVLREIERNNNGIGLTKEQEEEMVNDCCPSEFDYCPYPKYEGSQCGKSPLDCWNKEFIPDEKVEEILDFIEYAENEIGKKLEKRNKEYKK